MEDAAHESIRAAELVVAAAGYGKTTLLRRRHPGPDVAWCTGAQLAAGDVAVGAGTRTVVVDDLPPLTGPALARLIAALPPVRVVLAGRTPVAGVRLPVTGPAALALSAGRTAALLADHGLPDPDLADAVLRATGGWPALVRLSADACAAWDPDPDLLVRQLADPGGALAAYVTAEVLGPLPPQVRSLLADLVDAGPIGPGLGAALGHPAAPGILRGLEEVGVIVAGAVVPVVAEIVRRGVPAGHRRRVAAAAADYFTLAGPPIAAVRGYAAADLDERAAAILDTDGPALLAAGYAADIVAVLDRLPRKELDRSRLLLLGDALRVRGQVLPAEHAYAAVEGPVDAGLAWRRGLVWYLRGDARRALATFGTCADTGSGADGALLAAWTAAARLQLGELEEATVTARRAVALASAAGDDVALATAYVSLALCSEVAGPAPETEELLVQALAIAERCGEVVLRARILVTHTYRLLREARYAEALDAARDSERCATAAGHANLRSIALCNEGDALTMTGAYDAAVAQYERALASCRRMGSRRSAAAQLGLGEVSRRRGWTEQARAAYEQAAQLAEEAGNHQVLVDAYAGLARTLAAEDQAAAAKAADRCASLAPAATGVLLARGWIELHCGEGRAAAGYADDAAAAARTAADRAGLAEALELRAAADTDPARRRAALREAYAIWAAAGAAVEAARIACRLGTLPAADTDDRLNALLGAETLTAAGVSVPTGRTGDGAAVALHAFGRFEVVVAGASVPPGQWKSRKARDLLGMLVARRGRPVPREELCELLWPGDDAGPTGHRLSVLLSIVRAVLDPERVLPADHYVVADLASVALDTTRVGIDVEEFLADVGHARRLRDRGAVAQAYALLAAADRRYRGEVFADDPYADWAAALREEARTAYLGALRMLAQTSRALGDPASAVGYLLRLLAVDPYDEGGHQALVEARTAGGQHGEARRAYARYRAAMAEIGVRPAYTLP
ncbi:BTAD domain-containing putative transcriptional regulator [Hamadaea tsunoensis]|uniref:BTAD domain-containing putative transcriptional regulator n=1 Tax=Hamadaea tsunoensis TaxID=53368 RepID=UPI0004141673|nr:BTAD domain-containing putative transcriptional regulator [Hamadaea tsunoensis]